MRYLKMKQQQHDINFEEDSEKNPSPRWDNVCETCVGPPPPPPPTHTAIEVSSKPLVFSIGLYGRGSRVSVPLAALGTPRAQVHAYKTMRSPSQKK